MPLSSAKCDFCQHLFIEHQITFGFCQHLGGCNKRCPRFVEPHPPAPDIQQHFKEGEETKVRKHDRERTGQ
jgi:hypothetical protein